MGRGVRGQVVSKHPLNQNNYDLVSVASLKACRDDHKPVNPTPRPFIMLIEPLLSLFLQLNIDTSKVIKIQDDFQNNVAIELVLDELSDCESNQNPLAINRHDQKDNSHSYGLYQWGIDSFWYYNEKYKVVPNLEKQEVENIIYDPIIQRDLTRLVLKEKNGWMNWYNCGLKLSLEDRLK